MLLALVIAATTATAVPAAKPAAAPPPVAKPVPAPAAPAVVPAAPATTAAVAPAPAVDAPAFPKTIPAAQRVLIAEQVMLDRAHFTPGVIDGRTGSNFTNAAAAWTAAHKGNKIADSDKAPVLARHTISADEANGPYLKTVPKDFELLAKLDKVGFTSPREALAEAFHMDEGLLVRLNPGADFGKEGTVIVVAAVEGDKLGGKVAKIEVDKSHQRLTAFDTAGTVLASYPATVGSTERPAPDGEWAVRTVAPAPTYTYDPKRLTFGKPKEKLTIAAGPNNPVGSTWIALTKDTYGIHGTPDPSLVGKRASHGCVRLTNWDAHQLGAAVEKGTKVVFMGAETRAKT